MNNKFDFDKLFTRQINFQEMVTGDKCPGDHLNHFSYHVQAMVEEMGEVMKADKRWKTHRNERYEKHEKLDELADVLITLMNLTIHSGFTSQELLEEVFLKIVGNERRWEERNNDNDC